MIGQNCKDLIAYLKGKIPGSNQIGLIEGLFTYHILKQTFGKTTFFKKEDAKLSTTVFNELDSLGYTKYSPNQIRGYLSTYHRTFSITEPKDKDRNYCSDGYVIIELTNEGLEFFYLNAIIIENWYKEYVENTKLN